MRITIERSGGFAGMVQTRVVDTASLPPNEVNQLRLLVDAADFFRLPKMIVSLHSQPDRFQYKLTVEDQGKRHTVVVGEQSMPGNLKPLLDWLMTAARRS